MVVATVDTVVVQCIMVIIQCSAIEMASSVVYPLVGVLAYQEKEVAKSENDGKMMIKSLAVHGGRADTC
jgi:hypothetical protein